MKPPPPVITIDSPALGMRYTIRHTATSASPMEGTTVTDGPFTTVSRELPLADRVAAKLEEAILHSGRYQPGDQLPSERLLADQFGVSRTVIREAVRSLTAKGLLEVRSGSGSRVAAVDARTVAESMSSFLRRHKTLDYGKIDEVRSVLEIQVAGLAAERATDVEVAALNDTLAAMEAASGDPRLASELDVEFHRSVARITHNELFLIMLDSIGAVLMEIRLATLPVPGRIAETVHEHRRILDGIAARDAAVARSAMRDHLAQSLRLWNDAQTNQSR